MKETCNSLVLVLGCGAGLSSKTGADEVEEARDGEKLGLEMWSSVSPFSISFSSSGRGKESVL